MPSNSDIASGHRRRAVKILFKVSVYVYSRQSRTDTFRAFKMTIKVVMIRIVNLALSKFCLRKIERKILIINIKILFFILTVI